MNHEERCNQWSDGFDASRLARMMDDADNLYRERLRLVQVCSGRIHDNEAAKVADINSMYTEAHDDNEGSYQHLPTCMGGQGRSDAEIESWGETLCSFFTILGVGLVVGVVMFVAAIVAKGGV